MLEVRLLGALTASLDGPPVDLGSARRRALVARLAVAEARWCPSTGSSTTSGTANRRPVPSPGCRPTSATRAAPSNRTPRTPATVLVSAAGGYALHAALDVGRANALRRSGTVPDLRAALALFTGPPPAEFGDAGWAARHALAAGPVAGIDRVLDHVERAAAQARRDRVPRVAADLLAGALDLVDDPARGLRLRCALASAYSHTGAGRSRR